MGSDIHLHIEMKVDGKWEHYGCPKVDRDYRLFEKMAGVRGNIENAIHEPKGLPKDISILTELDYNGYESYWHSASWLDIKEVKELRQWLDSRGGYMNGYDLEHNILKTYLFSNSLTCLDEFDSIEDMRLVFWFDN